MNFAAASTPLSVEVTFDSPVLNVALSVYDLTTGTPVLILGPQAMVNVVGNSYYGEFTPILGKRYFIFKAAYTDGTFITLDPIQPQSSETVVCNSVNILPGQSAPARNEPLNAFTFLMLNATTQAPLSGLAVTATRSIDGSGFAPCANVVTEIANGWYEIDLAASDMNGAVIAINFSAVGADVTAATILTQE